MLVFLTFKVMKKLDTVINIVYVLVYVLFICQREYIM